MILKIPFITIYRSFYNEINLTIDELEILKDTTVYIYVINNHKVKCFIN